MKEDLQNKFDALFKDYSQKLPEKMAEINAKWEQLKKNWDPEVQNELFMKIHGLKGSSRIYGYKNLGQIAEAIEKLSGELATNKAPTAEQIKQLEKHFAEFNKPEALKQENNMLAKLNIPIISHSADFKSDKTVKSKKVFFLNKDTVLDAKNMSEFGYELTVYSGLYLFTKTLTTEQPDFLIIDMEEVIDLDATEVQELNEKYLKNIPRIFISRSSAFNFRLRAVELHGKAFILKPFSLKEIVAVLDNLSYQHNRHYRVLIIDDELEVANYYSKILTEAGMMTEVITKASQVDQAMHEFKPDLVISDFHMPECDGLELASIIRQQKSYEAMPIIFLSSEDDKLVQLKAMSSGADDFVEKGVKPEHLILAIINKADRYRRLQELIFEDNLTGLLNQKAIMLALENEIKAASFYKKSFCIALIDLDDFSNINKKFSHAAGDQVLKTFGFLLNSKLRAKDIAGRSGDEEFLVILPDTSLEAGTAVIEEIKAVFAATDYWWDYRMFTATFSACLAAYPTFSTSLILIDTVKKCLKGLKTNSLKALDDKTVMEKNS